ncbi:MAG: LexA family transcriptional regulator [Candidatus Neomarinimicrobiota bacterium]
MSIAKRLKAIRNDLDLSQEKFAHELDIHLRSYVSYENGSRAIPQKVMLDLMQMGYNIHWLLNGSGTMNLLHTINNEAPDYPSKNDIPILTNPIAVFKNTILPDTGLSTNTLPRPENNEDPFAYAVQIKSLKDEGMSPVFHPKEYILLSPLETITNNDKALIKLKDGRMLFRLIQFKDYNIELIAVNPKFEQETISSEELVFAHKVIGSIKT